MRRLSAVVAALALVGWGVASANTMTSGKGEDGYYGGGGSTRGIGSPPGGAVGERTREFMADPTGTEGSSYTVSGSIYGDTRGPGALEIQPERVGANFKVPAALPAKAQPELGHVPTDEQLARGAQTANNFLGPIPRPKVGGEPSGY